LVTGTLGGLVLRDFAAATAVICGAMLLMEDGSREEWEQRRLEVLHD